MSNATLSTAPVAFSTALATAMACGLLAMVTPPDARAATLSVSNCNDSGAGSLRERVAAAASGDTVDLRGLACSRITLTSGAIAIAQDTLTLQGPGWRRLVVSGDYRGSVFRHTGAGTLRLRGLSIEKGNRQAMRALGGCVYSAGHLSAYDVDIGHCGAHGLGTAPTAGMGGAVYTGGNATLSYSSVHDNAARGRDSYGGGIYANGKLTLKRARVATSNARIGGGAYALGGLSLDTVTFTRNFAQESGGLEAHGPADIVDSTIAGNTANGLAAGLWLGSLDAKRIVNTTVSGNRSSAISAGVITGTLLLANSTIAHNLSDTAMNPGQTCYGTLMLMSAQLQSSIVASNTCDGAPVADIIGTSFADPVTGADNLVMSSAVPLPADTLTSDPLLGPLADNGGRTLTHALPAGSPALDAGNNAQGLAYDQRGIGFPRVRGTRTDIGAFER